MGSDSTARRPQLPEPFWLQDWCVHTSTNRIDRGDVTVKLEPRTMEVLVYLAERAGEAVTREELEREVWRGKIVGYDALSQTIVKLRTAFGDDARHPRIIETLPKIGYQLIAEVVGAAKTAPINQTLEQKIGFCTAPDGVRIAYATIGEGSPLVKTANWLTHLEYDLQSPVWRHLPRELAKDNLLVRYDQRGNGLSDWEVDDFSFEAFVHDLETVVDAVGLDRFALLGISQGCAISVAYAVRHPERVTHLILYGGYVKGVRHRGSQELIERDQAFQTLVKQGWGQDNPAFRQIFTSRFIPGATTEQMQWYNDLQRVTASPENTVRLRQSFGQIDVSSLLPQVTVPTLVMHVRDDGAQPFEQGRELAMSIPGARFVPLEGKNHLIMEHEPAWPRFLTEVRNFLRS